MTTKYKVSITEIGLDSKLPNYNYDVENPRLITEKSKENKQKTKFPNILQTNENNLFRKKELIVETLIDKQRTRMNSILNNVKQGVAKGDINKFNSLLNNYYNIVTDTNINTRKDLNQKPSTLRGLSKNQVFKDKERQYSNISDYENRIKNVTQEYLEYSKSELIKIISDKEDLIEYLTFNNDRLQKKVKDLTSIKDKMEQELIYKSMINEENTNLKQGLILKDHQNFENKSKEENSNSANKSKF